MFHVFLPFYLQLHFDNDREARREREVRLTGSKLDLNFCGAPRASATTLSSSVRTIDSHGNAVSTLSSPQSSSSNNNVSPTHDESEKFTPMTPAGECCTLLNLQFISLNRYKICINGNCLKLWLERLKVWFWNRTRVVCVDSRQGRQR